MYRPTARLMITRGGGTSPEEARDDVRPRPDEGWILALVSGRAARAVVHEAVRQRWSVRFASSVRDAHQLLVGDSGHLVAVVSEPTDMSGMLTGAFLRQLTARWPVLPLIGFASGSPGDARELLDLARAGVHELVLRGDGEVRGLRNAIAGAARTAAAGRVLDHLARHAAPEIVPVLQHCLYYPTRSTSVSELAAALGMHRKTLYTLCSRHGMPVPSKLGIWCRLLLAGLLLEETGQSIEQIALLLGFASASAFYNLWRRYVGCRPSEARSSGGFMRAYDRFLEYANLSRPLSSTPSAGQGLAR